jgi:hypothetical protein
VTITGIKVLKNCHTPLTGTLFVLGAQGDNNTIGLGFDLDRTISEAQNAQPDQPFSGDAFPGSDITLGYGETQTFAISVSTHLYYCQFNFQMTVSTPNGPVTEYFGAAGLEKSVAAGQPFQLTAVAHPARQGSGPPFSAYQAAYVGGADSPTPVYKWVQVNPKTYKFGLAN